MAMVSVVFRQMNGIYGGQQYSYFLPAHLEMDDWAVVDTPRNGPQIVKIVGEAENNRATKRILATFNLKEERKLREKD